MGTAVIVYNPVAGSALGREAAEAAEQHLLSSGWDVRTIETHGRSGTMDVARDVADEIDLLVVAGGDGSLREAIEGLGAARDRVTLGFLPVGNANVAARELGIPTSIREATRVLTTGNETLVDLGVVGDGETSQLFLAVVGIGWDAITVRHLDRLRHSRVGRIWYRLWADSAYFVCGLLALLSIRPARFRVIVDGVERKASYRAAHFCNFRAYGKGMVVTPEADFQSGQLHYQARKQSIIPALAWHLISAYLKTRVPRFISDYGAGKSVVVECSRAMPVQVDGDYLEHTSRIDLRIIPAAVRILTPAQR